MKNQEIGLLALKFVEIIGEDEISDLDPETVYFITHILNKAKLTRFRDQYSTNYGPTIREFKIKYSLIMSPKKIVIEPDPTF